MVAARPKIELKGGLTCLYVGCKTKGDLTLYPSDFGYGIDYDDKQWLFWALGFPSRSKNYGVCKEHQAITLDLDLPDSIEVRVRQETHGVFYEMSTTKDGKIAKGTFATNVLRWQFTPGTDVTPRVQLGADRISELYSFAQPSNIVDELARPEAKAQILAGGPLQPADGKQVSLRETYWVTDVEYTCRDGSRTVIRLTQAQMTEWRKRG